MQITLNNTKNLRIVDYLHGNPEQIIASSKKPSILVVGLHGNEELAARVAYHIASKRTDLLEYVDYVCGNPVAARAGTRSSDPLQDLNRSFNLPLNDQHYESKRARELQALFPRYDYVLDVHTSETDCDRFCLVSDAASKSYEPIIAASPFTRIVVLPAELTQHSLIGAVPSSLSIEYNERLADTPAAVEEVIATIDNLIVSKQQQIERSFYIIDHAVPKTDDPGDVTNFEKCSAGYYPVLFGIGPKSYRNDPSKSYLGFAATQLEKVVL